MKNISEFINESTGRLYGMTFDIKDIKNMSKEELETAHKELGDIFYKLKDHKMSTSTIKKYIAQVEELMKQ